MSDVRVNPVVARAAEHFSELERYEAEVPEWGEEGAPLLLYATRLTMAERRRIQKQNPNDNFGATCDIVILKAEDADGNRVFSKKDKPWFLNKMDPEVILRVARDLTGGEELPEELPEGFHDDLSRGIDDAGKG